MTERRSEATTRYLLVEGREDQEFFIRLAKHMAFDTDTWPLKIYQYCGRSGLRDRLRTLARPDTLEQIERIGIVRDADFNTDAFSSVQDAIRNSQERNTIQLPVPTQVKQWTEPCEGRPNVGVLVLPTDGREGMLEDLIMDVFADDAVTSCMDSYFDCIRKSNLVVSENKLSKARLRAFVTGKNVSDDSEGDDSDKLYLSDVFHMSWWKDEFWDKPAFREAKAFLTQLLAD